MTSPLLSNTAVKTSLVVATRRSPLALWQAEHVQAQLAKHGVQVELLPMSTQGDRVLDSPLAAIGGKGLFVKELEHALLDGRADFAVHSLKDVPAELPAGLALPIQMSREDPTDALVSNHFSDFNALPPGARVGTSSLRRRCQLLAARPDLTILDLRGNVGTRLGKLDAGEYDAIVLASAGLKRLKLGERIAEALAPERCIPAIGQGILGLETRDGDAATLAALQPLHDKDAADCAAAERALNGALAGGCQAPVAGYATLEGDQLTITGMVGEVDGGVVLRKSASGHRRDAAALGRKLAGLLEQAGARDILAALGIEPPVLPVSTS